MISYRTPNRAEADELYASFEAAGMSPWMDYRRISPGSQWREELLNEVRCCDVFVALLTADYLQSEHCRMEILVARSRGCPVLPVVLEDCFYLLDRYEETKGLADTFMVRLYRLSVVGLTITREEAIRRVVSAALAVGQQPPTKAVYVCYCNHEADTATRIARQLENDGIPAWIATQNCNVGDNWRQAQARGLMNASLQVIVLDDTILKANVLRTEILLAEAFGLPLFTVLGTKLSADAEGVAVLMKDLRASDITYERLTRLQPFRCDQSSIADLGRQIRAKLRAPGK
jgi:hypothetical protein